MEYFAYIGICWRMMFVGEYKEAHLNCDPATSGTSCVGTATVLLSCSLLFDSISQSIFLLCLGTLKANYADFK
jgi:hypothetical protein